MTWLSKKSERPAWERRTIERARAQDIACECERCDGWPMYWHKDDRLPDGGWYRCNAKLSKYRTNAYLKRLRDGIAEKEARLAAMTLG